MNEREALAASILVAERMKKEGILTDAEFEAAVLRLCLKHGIKKESTTVRMMLIQSPERACICTGGNDHAEGNEGPLDAGEAEG